MPMGRPYQQVLKSPQNTDPVCIKKEKKNQTIFSTNKIWLKGLIPVLDTEPILAMFPLWCWKKGALSPLDSFQMELIFKCSYFVRKYVCMDKLDAQTLSPIYKTIQTSWTFLLTYLKTTVR